MLYAIIGHDAPDSLATRKRARPDHLTRINLLQDEGRLIIAGPCPAIDSTDPGPAGFTGSLIVAEFDTLAEATDWINADPYFTEGVFDSVTVKPFIKVLP